MDDISIPAIRTTPVVGSVEPDRGPKRMQRPRSERLRQPYLQRPAQPVEQLDFFVQPDQRHHRQRRPVQFAEPGHSDRRLQRRPRWLSRSPAISASAPAHPGHFNRQNYHFTDSLHWIKGQHEISLGGDLMKMQVDLINTFRQNGNFRFRGTSYSGDPRSDFLLGCVGPLHSGRRRIRAQARHAGQPVHSG